MEHISSHCIEVEHEDSSARHLRWSNYFIYFDRARILAQEHAGIGDETLATRGYSLIVKGFPIIYRTEVPVRRKVYIHSDFGNYRGGVILIITQKMILDGTVCAELETKNGFVIRNEHGILVPTRPPEDLVAKLISSQ